MADRGVARADDAYTVGRTLLSAGREWLYVEAEFEADRQTGRQRYAEETGRSRSRRTAGIAWRHQADNDHAKHQQSTEHGRQRRKDAATPGRPVEQVHTWPAYLVRNFRSASF